MKKRNQSIPDFSSKPKGSGFRTVPAPKTQPPPNTPPRVTKPQATSSKSGRRGG